jgi:tRNA dimethylallyltransferase
MSTPTTNVTSDSSELTSLLSSLAPELKKLYDTLPDDPPSATSDPEAAFALHNLLTVLDPQMASRWHWKDTRKVLRSLEIIRQTGQRPSEIIAAQKDIPATPR